MVGNLQKLHPPTQPTVQKSQVKSFRLCLISCMFISTLTPDA